ncbi:zinc finger domain-containing protein [Kineococcus sp. R86509]|uniref:zinc finger domain-containing protein n=1 Tax=Kineococcus sp. R86509 TaxID=3093851 RepID=UPI0036D3E3AC
MRRAVGSASSARALDLPDPTGERETCRRCGTPVRSWTLAGRTAWVCPTDQS